MVAPRHLARSPLPLLLLVGFVLGSPRPAGASHLTFGFSFLVTRLINSSETGISVGDVVDGSFTFDPDTPAAPGSSESGQFFTGALVSAEVQLPGYTLSFLRSGMATNIIAVSNDGYTGDYYSMRTALGAGEWLDVFLRDVSGQAWDDAALPLTPPDLASFPETYAAFGLRTIAEVSGPLLSLTLLPEPRTGQLVLLVLGLATAGYARSGVRHRPVR